MSTHPGRTKRINGVDFSVMSFEEQKKYSREHMTQDQKAVNEKIAREASKKLDELRRQHIQ